MNDANERPKLKPCPFCGEVPNVFYWKAHINDDLHYNLVCIKCGAGFSDFPLEKLPEMFELWNRRISNE